MTETLEELAKRMGWKLRAIDLKTTPTSIDLNNFNQRLSGIATHIINTFRGTTYGISGAEDYSLHNRDKIMGLFSIYSAEHDERGNLRLIDSASVRVFPGTYVLAQCHDPEDRNLQDLCRCLTGNYHESTGKFMSVDVSQPE